MRINEDLDRPARVDVNRAEWRPAPVAGIHRCMLERHGDELARATSVVAYEPGREFPAHEHPGGEEILVVAGLFADENGRYPAGTYLRNPVGSAHAPYTPQGCLLLVKLWWMHAADHRHVRQETLDPRPWQPGGTPGVNQLHLHRFRDERTLMLDMAPGSCVPAHHVEGGEELFVVSGSCDDGISEHREWVWMRYPPGGCVPRVRTGNGCRLFVKRGHLRHPPPPPAAS